MHRSALTVSSIMACLLIALAAATSNAATPAVNAADTKTGIAQSAADARQKK